MYFKCMTSYVLDIFKKICDGLKLAVFAQGCHTIRLPHHSYSHTVNQYINNADICIKV